MPTHRTPLAAALATALLLLAGCSASTDDADDASDPAATGSAEATEVTTTPATPAATPDETPAASAAQDFPDVLEVELTASGDTWSVAATISSPYDSPERYADAFRVLGPDDTELGVRELLHDHGAEQPFTRSLDGLAIPDDVTEVTVEGRDLANGWGGDTVTVPVPR